MSRRDSLLFFLFLAGLVFAQTSGPTQKIGLAFALGGRGDRCDNDLAYEGLIEIAKNFNGYFTTSADPRHGGELEIKYLTPSQDTPQERLRVLRQLGQEGYRLVFAVGFLFSDVLPVAAQEYPNTHFVLIDGYLAGVQPQDNITVVDFRVHEGSFLAGMIAGLKTEGNKVGFIGGMNTERIQRYESGFRAGAVYANPMLKRPGQFLVEYIGDDPRAFNDPNRAYRIAQRMYRAGAGVVFHVAGASGMGVFRAAKESQRWAIGSGSDQGAVLAFDRNPQILEQARWVLTSMLKRIDRSIFLMTRDFLLKGRIADRYHILGFNADSVGFAVNQLNKDLLGQALIQQIINTRIRIMDQEIIVPANYRELEQFLRN